MHDVKTEVRAILAEQLALLEKNIQDDQRLRDDLGADSLDLVEIQMELEERHGWEIPEAEADRFHAMTVGDLTAWVERRMSAAV